VPASGSGPGYPLVHILDETARARIALKAEQHKRNRPSKYIRPHKFPSMRFCQNASAVVRPVC